MSSIAAALRKEALRASRASTAEARVRVALELGDTDVQLRAVAAGTPPAETRRALQRQRAQGRRPSRCAER